MFIISVFTGSILRMIMGFILLVVLLVVAFVVVVGALAATGGPDACAPGDGPITVDAPNATLFQQKWDALDTGLSNGQTASATFSESEISSRADAYLKEHDVGFKNPRVCIHNGSGEGSATFSFLGIDVKIKVGGTVDLSGSHPKAHVDHMDIGNVPGWLTAPVEGAVNRAIDSALNDVDLKHHYTPQLSPGQATINGTP